MIDELVGKKVRAFYAAYGTSEVEVVGTLVAYTDGWMKVQSDDSVGTRYLNQAHIDCIIPLVDESEVNAS